MFAVDTGDGDDLPAYEKKVLYEDGVVVLIYDAVETTEIMRERDDEDNSDVLVVAPTVCR